MCGFLDESRSAFVTAELSFGPLDLQIDTGNGASDLVGVSPRTLPFNVCVGVSPLTPFGPQVSVRIKGSGRRPVGRGVGEVQRPAPSGPHPT